ncbi:MAG TPA: CoA pyrophosphatase [Actinomycetota bacterium]|nr:CoA pyrophosphatase [Actinomycetota bacterium]
MPDRLPETLRARLFEAGSGPDVPDATRAAVLVPLVEIEGDWAVVFTKRALDLKHHRGEISFPGGRVDEDEEGKQAAIRESFEELGIVADHVDILGKLPNVFTMVSGYLIEPWVGVIPRAEYVLSPLEVGEVIEVPLEQLIEPDARRVQKFLRGGAIYENLAYDVGPHVIWGATARILTDLLGLLD